MPKIKVNDIHMYYEIHGEGFPLVFISGFGADHTLWNNLIDDYAKHYKVIVFDNRGAGQTHCPDSPYSMDLLAKDAAGLCKALKIDRAHFIGSSMGGAITQTLAYKFPKLVASIVLENSNFKTNIRFALYAKARHEFIKMRAPRRVLAEGNLGWIFSSKFLMQPKQIDTIVQTNLANPYPITAVGYYNQLQAVLGFNSESWLKEINVPCLVLGADEDIIVFEKNARRLAELIPNAKYHCFTECGHVPHLEQKENYNKVVKEFLHSNAK